MRACPALAPPLRSIPRLRTADVEAFGSVEELNEFVDRLLLLRDPGSALVEFEFDLRGFLQLDDARVDLWIRHALMCHVRVLQVHLYTDRRVELADQPLVSRHLTRLELDGVLLEESFLDFSSCPVLEDLKVTNCVISADKILSQSLKHLSIMGCELCWRLLPTHVSAPSLVSLQLDDYVGVTPILESMLLLQTASVKLGHNNEDYCYFCDKCSSGDCTCSMCLLRMLIGGNIMAGGPNKQPNPSCSSSFTRFRSPVFLQIALGKLLV